MYLAIKHLYIDNITFGLYPKLALMFDSTPGRVERGIRHLIELFTVSLGLKSDFIDLNNARLSLNLGLHGHFTGRRQHLAADAVIVTGIGAFALDAGGGVDIATTALVVGKQIAVLFHIHAEHT